MQNAIPTWTTDSHQVLGDHCKQNPETRKHHIFYLKGFFFPFSESEGPKASSSTTHSPRLFHGEAVDSQHTAQSILGAVDDVLLLLVVQLLLDDVLTQVEHYLQKHRDTSWDDCRMHRLIITFGCFVIVVFKHQQFYHHYKTAVRLAEVMHSEKG